MKSAGTGDDLLEGGERQSYLVTVSDLMAGLLFFFIITLMLVSVRLKVGAERHERFANQVNTIKNSRNEILKQISEELRRKGIVARIDYEQGVLGFEEEEKGIFFGLCRDEPNQRSKRNTSTLARVLYDSICCYTESCLNSCDNKDYDARIDTLMIEGHTDNKPIRGGTSCKVRFGNNLRLSAGRAAWVKEYLEGPRGEPKLRELLNSKGSPVLSISGYGQLRPRRDLSPGDEGNRRIDLRFVMEPPRSAENSGTAFEPEVIDDVRQELQ